MHQGMPIQQKCFVCKTEAEVSGSVVVLHKCAVTKEDAMSGDVPIVPHLYFPSFLDDNIPKPDTRASSEI